MNSLTTSPATQLALVEFTSRCNLACVYCSRHCDGYRLADIDSSMLGRIVDELCERGLKTLVVNGHGETTVFPQWHLHCQQMTERGIPVSIISNLSKNFSQDEIETLSRFTVVETSCDTIDPALFALLRKGSSLERVVGNMFSIANAARSQGRQPPAFSWSCVVTDRTVMGLEELVATALRIGVKKFTFNELSVDQVTMDAGIVRPVSHLPPDQLLEAAKSLRRALAAIEQGGATVYCQPKLPNSITAALARGFGGVGPDQDDPIPVAPGLTRLCVDPWTMLFFHADGTYAPCCVQGSVGTFLPDVSVEQLAQSSELQLLREELLSGNLRESCRMCPAKSLAPLKELEAKLRALFEECTVCHKGPVAND